MTQPNQLFGHDFSSVLSQLQLAADAASSAVSKLLATAPRPHDAAGFTHVCTGAHAALSAAMEFLKHPNETAIAIDGALASLQQRVGELTSGMPGEELAMPKGRRLKKFPGWKMLTALGQPGVSKACLIAGGLPRARAGDIERTLSVGLQLGLFGQVGPLSWRSCDNTLASQLAPLLEGARLYRTRVHQDTDLVEVVLTKPPAPSQVSRKLESMLSGGWGFRDTKQLLPAIAGSAQRSLIVMTPFFDDDGAEVVWNLFENTAAVDKCLILRATKEGLPPEGLEKVGAKLVALGVEVLNFRLDRPGSTGNETFHAKAVLGDDDTAYVGSSNMNQWSFEHSLELGLYVRGRAAFRIAELLQAVRAVSGPMQAG